MTISASLRFVTDFAPNAREAAGAARELGSALRSLSKITPPNAAAFAASFKQIASAAPQLRDANAARALAASPRSIARANEPLSLTLARQDAKAAREREQSFVKSQKRFEKLSLQSQEQQAKELESRRRQVLADSGESDVSRAIGGALTIGAAAGAASAGARGFNAVLQAQAFREDTIRALGLIRKTQGDAEAVQKRAFATADFLGRDRQETARDFLDLLTKGLAVDKVDTLVKSLSDLRTVDPRANIEGVTRAIGQIASKGRLQGDELLQLAENGLETSAVYQALSKSLGKTVPEIIKLQAAGKIKSDVAIDAIIAGINQQAGGLEAGAAAAKKSIEDISGLQLRLANSLPNLLGSVEASNGVADVKDFLRDIIALLDPATSSGQRASKAIGGVFEAFTAGILGQDPTKGLQSGFSNLLDIVENSRPAFFELGQSLRDIADAAALLTGVVSFFSGFGEGLRSFGIAGHIAADAIRAVIKQTVGGPLLSIISLINQIRNDFAEPFDLTPWGKSLIEQLSDIPNILYGFGLNAVNALARGITDATGAVTIAASNVGTGLVSAARSALGIASPSREGLAIGRFFDQGVERGINRGADDVMLAARYMSLDAARGASLQAVAGRSLADQFPIVGGGAKSAKAANGGNVFNISVTVQGPASSAEWVEEASRRGVMTALREINEQGGFSADNA